MHASERITLSLGLGIGSAGQPRSAEICQVTARRAHHALCGDLTHSPLPPSSSENARQCLRAQDACVQVSTWVPQNDVLAHPNTKAFLSHCGGNSMYEVRITSASIT